MGMRKRGFLGLDATAIAVISIITLAILLTIVFVILKDKGINLFEYAKDLMRFKAGA